MLKVHWLWIVLGVLTIALLSFMLGGIADAWDIISCSFFEITISDVVQTFLVLIIAIFITYFVNIKTSKDLRRKEVVLELFDECISEFNKIFSLGCDYMNNAKDCSEDIINKYFTIAGNRLVLINNFKERGLKDLVQLDVGSLITCHFEMKKALTDTPWKSANREYTPKQKIEFSRNYIKILEELHKSKMDLWL